MSGVLRCVRSYTTNDDRSRALVERAIGFDPNGANILSQDEQQELGEQSLALEASDAMKRT